MRAKILDLPNGRQVRSESIRNVKVFPERSPSSGRLFMEIYGVEGIVYSGVIDLERVVAADCLPLRE